AASATPCSCASTPTSICRPNSARNRYNQSHQSPFLSSQYYPSGGPHMANLAVHPLLTPENCVVTFIDHQPQMLFGVANFDRQTIINNVVGLAKAAKVFNIPVVLSTVETKSFSGYIWPQLRAVYPEHKLYERTSMNAWEDKAYVQAIEQTGRKKNVMTGLWTEVCVTFPTIQAIEAGDEG